MAARTLYVLYNADGSVMGKLRYGYKKVTCDKAEGPECSACEITHGGLSLKETPEWVQAKAAIEEGEKVKVRQLHRDELTDNVKAFVEKNGVGFPSVLVEEAGELSVVMTRAELDGYKGNTEMFVSGLKSKGVA